MRTNKSMFDRWEAYSSNIQIDYGYFERFSRVFISALLLFCNISVEWKQFQKIEVQNGAMDFLEDQIQDSAFCPISLNSFVTSMQKRTENESL